MERKLIDSWIIVEGIFKETYKFEELYPNHFCCVIIVE